MSDFCTTVVNTQLSSAGLPQVHTPMIPYIVSMYCVFSLHAFPIRSTGVLVFFFAFCANSLFSIVLVLNDFHNSHYYFFVDRTSFVRLEKRSI